MHSIFAIVLATSVSALPNWTRVRDAQQQLQISSVDSVVADIEGFNARHSLCDAARATAEAKFDRTHGTTFTRTLGYRYDVPSSRLIPADPADAEVTLLYSGPVRSGSIAINGTGRSFCRAEAPDKIATAARFRRSDGSEFGFSSSEAITAFAQGLTGAAGSSGPSVDKSETPRSAIDARIAKAIGILNAAKPDAILAASRRDTTCSKQEALGQKPSESSRSTSLRSWIGRSGTDWETDITARGPAYTGAIVVDGVATWVCGALSEPMILAARARWWQEGEVVLTFTAPRAAPR